MMFLTIVDARIDNDDYILTNLEREVIYPLCFICHSFPKEIAIVSGHYRDYFE